MILSPVERFEQWVKGQKGYLFLCGRVFTIVHVNQGSHRIFEDTGTEIVHIGDYNRDKFNQWAVRFMEKVGLDCPELVAHFVTVRLMGSK